MPLKLICGRCGELMFQSSMKELHLSYKDASVPAIIVDKLGSKCPGCGRVFTSEDLETWHKRLKISGARATQSFYEESGRRKREWHKHSLHVGHGEPESFAVVKFKKRGRPRK